MKKKFNGFFKSNKTDYKKIPKLSEPLIVRTMIITISVLFILIFICVPLLLVFVKAFAKGWEAYINSITEPETFSAIKLTLLTAVIAVPCNMIFGIIASWLIAKFNFHGKSLLTSLIDLPFAVSPVISGLVFVLLFGRNGWFGGWLFDNDIKIIFAVPGIVLATIFVTFPFVARELIPIMQANGNEEEQAAIVLGAGPLKTFFSITLPNIKWALIYGVIICNARAMGEFGAVSVVSGHIRGETNTIPLQAEILYNEYQMNAAFAVASLLTFLAVITLAIKKFAEIKIRGELKQSSVITIGENI
ncbi:MAG: sulfate ABC transporter permease subunit CysW [Ignavibacteriaceae bacterium]